MITIGSRVLVMLPDEFPWFGTVIGETMGGTQGKAADYREFRVESKHEFTRTVDARYCRLASSFSPPNSGQPGRR